ncbi:MAG: hypothetical protein E6I38_11945 [Chloroflexi bacterium]|nr:MAG: hypothetical protein E6I38_11945 [Chloroflexota bacterium]TMG01171.1 MAG: hypothetical protein E6I03_09485 [Chloroflexota bacterium]
MTLDQVIARIRRVLMLEPAAYEEVRDDTQFTFVSIGAAAVAVLLAAIGAWLFGETVLDPAPGLGFVDTVILGTIFTIVLFLIGVAVIYLMLSQVFGEETTPDALVRVVTLTHLPFGLGLFVFIPQIGFAFGLASIAATFYYTIFGIRAAYPNVDALRAMIAVLLGFAVWAMVIPIISDYPDNNWVTGVFVYSLID